MGVGLLALLLVSTLALAARARAAENVYWDNYKGSPQSVSVADITGSGGGALNLSGVTLEGPEGMAYDSVTNRLFVGSSHPSADPAGEIVAINLDGSGASLLATPGVTPIEPEGVVVDPATRMIYWVNTGSADTIGYAKLDGSGGGLLNTAGASLEDPYKIALDPVAGRVYWANTKATLETISYANVNGSGGGNLNITGTPAPEEITGLSVDPAGGRVYWLDNGNKKVGFAPLGGGAAGEVNLAAATFNDPYGLAFDPSISRLYWANYGQSAERTNAIGFSNLAGAFGGISPVSAPLNGPQDPVILKSPLAAGAPTISRSTTTRSSLSCSTGTWGADYPGSFVYQAPRTFAYQWTLNGVAVAGATAATLNTTKPGSYGCIVTAANQTGNAAQTSAPVKVKAAKVKLTTKKKARVKAGGVATFKIKAVNQGDLKSKNARVCVKLPKKAKKALKAKPKCKPFGKVKGGGKDSAKLRIKVGATASGTYKVTFQVKGSPGKAAKAKIIVSAPKK
jgi:hypothetical protein